MDFNCLFPLKKKEEEERNSSSKASALYRSAADGKGNKKLKWRSVREGCSWIDVDLMLPHFLIS